MYVISGAAFSKVVPSLTFRVSNTHLCNRESKVGFWFLMYGNDDKLHNLPDPDSELLSRRGKRRLSLLIICRLRYGAGRA